jgi:Lrp/AsnC family transcriptional regulator, leucine-responsive regulatory protein
LKEHAAEFLENFLRDIQTLPRTIECYCVSGVADFLLKIIVEDIEKYKVFIFNKLSILANIGEITKVNLW